MKWLEMTMFVVFLWYPFNVKVGNVKEFAVECRTVEVDGEFRLLQKFGEALIWGLDPSGARCVPSWMGGSKNDLRPGGKTKSCGRTENWENWRVLNFWCFTHSDYKLWCLLAFLHNTLDEQQGFGASAQFLKLLYMISLNLHFGKLSWGTSSTMTRYDRSISRFHFHHIPLSRWLETFFVSFFL